MKYRLKFKALDARIGMRDRIIEYFKANKDYKGEGTEGYVDYVDHWGGDGRLYRVYFNLRDMLVSQHNYSSSPQYPIPFTGNDLRFFDELGFDLTPRHKDETKQEIDDWFDKKALDVGLITKERFVEAFKNLGYEEDDAEEGIKDQKADNTTWAVSKVVEGMKLLVRYYEGKDWTDYRGTAAILSRPVNGRKSLLQFVKGPDNVLRLLDNLGIELNEHHTLATGQKVDDWFKKAQDSIDLQAWRKPHSLEYKELCDYFDKFMESQGYKYHSTDGSSGLRQYRSDEQDARLHIWMSANNIFKRKLNEPIYTPFTNAELKFFDNLNYTITKDQSKFTGESIDDWFKTKANDIDVRQTIIDKLTSWGYKVSNDEFANDNPDTDTEYLIRMYYPKNDSPDVGEYITAYTDPEKVVAKEFCEFEGANGYLTCEYISFTREELQFFDNLGFNIESAQKQYINQNIDDWFWKYKANDMDIRDATVDAAESLGYMLRNEEEHTMIFFLADDYRAEPRNGIRLYFDFQYMNVEKTREDWIEERQELQSDYVAFTNKELKLFDNLGFHIDLNQAEFGPKQEMDDWFKKSKANDIDIKQTIVDFYKKNYPKLEVDATHNKTIYLIKKDKAYQIETNIYLDTQTVSRFKRRLKDGAAWGYEVFDMQELKLFDSLDFDFDTEYKTYTHQRMDDWFREENKNKK